MSETSPSRSGSAVFEALRVELANALGEDVTVDGLTARWSILQRRRGHRHSTDDLLTGWYALETSSDGVTRALDLGTGIGGVGLLVLSGLLEQEPDAHVVGVEAQDLSFRFLEANVRGNALEAHVTRIHGDLRDLALGERFLLVTGSPPYFDPGAGIVPSDTQKAHARFELRGDVRDYAKAAKRHLAPGGRFVFCFPWQQKARAMTAVESEGFGIVRHRDVVPRVGLAPLFSVFACTLDTGTPTTEEPPFVVRDEGGRHTPDLDRVRARFGWPIPAR